MSEQLTLLTDREPGGVAWARAIDGTERAATRWSPEQLEDVLAAIFIVAQHLQTFTTDAVWAELGRDFPVTKGMTGALVRAANLGWIEKTSQTRIATRGGEHDHAQRLTVWRSMLEVKL